MCAGFVAALMGVNLALGLADIERTLTAVIAVFTFNVLYEVILSRNTKQYAMAPLMDFLNHSSKVQVCTNCLNGLSTDTDAQASVGKSRHRSAL